MSKAEELVALGRAVCKFQNDFPPEPSDPLLTRDVHASMVDRGVFADEDQAKKGWARLAKLAAWGYPGVRVGEPQPAMWKNQQRMARPKEWHKAPTPEEMAKWESDVLNHRRTLAQEQTGNLKERVERLEQQVKELLASPAAPVQ